MCHIEEKKEHRKMHGAVGTAPEPHHVRFVHANIIVHEKLTWKSG